MVLTNRINFLGLREIYHEALPTVIYRTCTKQTNDKLLQTFEYMITIGFDTQPESPLNFMMIGKLRETLSYELMEKKTIDQIFSLSCHWAKPVCPQMLIWGVLEIGA